MSVMDACNAAIAGVWDNFDSALAAADYVEELLKNAEMPVELHNPAAEPAIAFFGYTGDIEACLHIYDPKDDMKAELQRARDLVNEARLICQTILGAL